MVNKTCEGDSTRTRRATVEAGGMIGDQEGGGSVALFPVLIQPTCYESANIHLPLINDHFHISYISGQIRDF